MATSSFNAPIISDEAAKNEREALTDDERLKVEQDVYGVTSSAVPLCYSHAVKGQSDILESCKIESSSLHGLEDEIEMINSAEKLEYLEALEKCPATVRKESDPLFFLRCENFDLKVCILQQ